jgi:hypothetical protein
METTETSCLGSRSIEEASQSSAASRRIAPACQLIFVNVTTREKKTSTNVSERTNLVVGKIIRPRLRRRNKYLVALDESTAMSAGRELIFVRVGSDDPSAARRQTINQPPIGRDSNHSDAHPTLARRRFRSNAFLFALRARLTRSGRLCNLGACRGGRSSLARS